MKKKLRRKNLIKILNMPLNKSNINQQSKILFKVFNCTRKLDVKTYFQMYCNVQKYIIQ